MAKFQKKLLEKDVKELGLKEGQVVYIPLEEVEKWSKDVKTKYEPPKDLFSKGSAQEIANTELKGHNGDIGKAIQSLSFYINRAGKNLDPKRKSVIEKAKDILQAKQEK